MIVLTAEIIIENEKSMQNNVQFIIIIVLNVFLLLSFKMQSISWSPNWNVDIIVLN